MSSRAGPSSKIPVVLIVDVEPDPFQVPRHVHEPWHGYEALHPVLAGMRERFEDATGSPVHYTWAFRMDPQIAGAYGSPTWAADRYAKLVKESLDRGDEPATHVHGYRWIEQKNGWLEDLANQDWMDRCLEMAVEAHRSAFGQPCATVRFGNFWLSTASVNLAEKLGIRYELTVEPGRPPFKWDAKGESTGDIPEVYRVPRQPYEPALEDFRRPAEAGSRSIRIVPLTAGWLKLGFRAGARLRRLLRNGYEYRLQDTPLSMWRDWPAPNSFDRMLDRALAAQARPYLAFAIRSSSGVDGTFERVNGCLQALLEHPQRERFAFTTPAEALKLLEGERA
jgi:hypothetical protein